MKKIPIDTFFYVFFMFFFLECQLWRRKESQYRKDIARGGVVAGAINRYHTPHIANSRPAKHTDELTGRATIITDRNHITQGTIIALQHLIEHIHETISRRSARKDHNFTLARARAGCHLAVVVVVVFVVFLFFGFFGFLLEGTKPNERGGFWRA